jgi:NSS family neurotransmitter:Na+ symporter
MNSFPPVEQWRSRTTFVLALALAAVGLGNIWRFGWLLGEHGGAPFLLSYILCMLLVGVPLLVAEVVLGSHGRGSPFLALRWSTGVSSRSRLWVVIAAVACLAALSLLVISFVVAGWTLSYAFSAQLGTFAAISLEESAAYLDELLRESVSLIEWQLLAAALVALVSAAGVRRGIGVLAWVAVPLIVTLLGVLIDFSLEFGDLEAASDFLFAWQPMDFDRGSFMAAFGHALYTLTLGVAVGMTYGAYTPRDLPIVRSVLAVALFDVAVAVAAAVVIFPILFANNLLPNQGFALLFISMPYAFGNMPFGDVFAALFFLAVFAAVLGTAVALMEPLVSVLEQQFVVRRLRAAVVIAILAWVLSAIATLDLGHGSGGTGLFLTLDHLGTEWLIPLAALLLALFVGWQMPRHILRRELSREPDILFSLWYFLLRFVAAPVIAIAWLWLQLVP